MEPCVLVSVPVAVLEVVPELGVAVPWVVLPCVPAVEPVPETDPDCVVPVSLDDAVRVLLLLLLQPKTSAAASARPYAYFIVLPPQRGFRGAPSEAPHQAPGSPRLLRRGRHRAVAMEASRTHGLSCVGRARRRWCSHAVRAASIPSARSGQDANHVRSVANRWWCPTSHPELPGSAVTSWDGGRAGGGPFSRRCSSPAGCSLPPGSTRAPHSSGSRSSPRPWPGRSGSFWRRRSAT